MLKKLISVLLSIVLVFLSSGCGKVYTNISEYSDYVDQVPGADAFMPVIDELPAFQSTEIYYFEDLGQSLNLIVAYDEDNYETAKNAILAGFDFLSEPVLHDGHYHVSDVEFEFSDFLIKVVEDSDFDYPKEFGMVGYSDLKKQVAFLFFYDDDLGRVGKMEEFVKNEFKFPKE